MPAKRIDECFLLYVEDDDATASLFQAALRETGVLPQFFRVTDGEHASHFLLRDKAFSDAPRPDLVLLDLNLPRKSGFDVLAEIKVCGMQSATVRLEYVKRLSISEF